MYGPLKEIWNTQQIPEDWNSAIIFPTFKKGDPMGTRNFRGYALLNSSYKTLSLAPLRKLEVSARMIINEYQCGFMRESSLQTTFLQSDK